MLGNINTERTGMVSPLKSSARRRLYFGEVDSKIVNDFAEPLAEIEAVYAKGKARWNYDFVQDCPVPGGRFAWAPVDQNNEYIPGPYLSSYKAKPKAPRRRPTVPYARAESVKRKITFDEIPAGFGDENVSPLAPSKDSAPAANTTPSSASTHINTTTNLLTQPKITAHFKQLKKKARMEKSSM